LNRCLPPAHFFYLHLQIQQVQIKHQPQVVIQLQTFFKVPLCFAVLSLSLMSQPAFGIDERVAVIK